MKKKEALSIFGGTRGLAEAIGVTYQAIYQWPDELEQQQIDRIVGAALRLGYGNILHGNKTKAGATK